MKARDTKQRTALRICCLVFWVALQAFGADDAVGPIRKLFDPPGKPVGDYNQQVRAIHANDRLVFNNGKTFTVVRKLGAGMATHVFEVTDDETHQTFALRLPFNENKGYLDLARSYLSTYKELVPLHLPLVKVYPELSFAPEYDLAELTPVQFTLEDVYLHPEKLKGIDPGNALAALPDFAKKFSGISELRDLHPGQLGWTTNNEWRLMDWGNYVKPLSRTEKGNPFAKFFTKYREYMQNLAHHPDRLIKVVKLEQDLINAVNDQRKVACDLPLAAVR